MASVQDLRRRVRSVGNTRKITKALELVAAAKLRRAQTRIEALRPFADRMLALMARTTGARPSWARLPISPELRETSDPERQEDARRGDFIFEPGPEEILARLLPVYLETELYRALLESAASFQGAQMTAMRNASKNAGELIVTLTL